MLTIGRLANGITIERDSSICRQHRVRLLLAVQLLGDNRGLGCGHATYVLGRRFRRYSALIDIQGLNDKFNSNLAQ